MVCLCCGIKKEKVRSKKFKESSVLCSNVEIGQQGGAPGVGYTADPSRVFHW